jgi:hypothetical protein
MDSAVIFLSDTGPSRKLIPVLNPYVSRISQGTIFRILLQDLHVTWTRQTRNSIQTRQTRLYPIWRVSANTKASDHRLDASNATLVALDSIQPNTGRKVAEYNLNVTWLEKV